MPNPSRSKQKHARSEKTRLKLLEAGIALFSKKGYDGVSTRELAAVADVTLSAIPYHFGSKKALYRAVIDLMDNDMKTVVIPAVMAAEKVAALEQCTRRQKVVALQQLVSEHARAVLTTRPEWINLAIQQQLKPELRTKSEQATGAALMKVTCRLVSALRDLPVDSSEVLLQSLTLYGRVAILRMFGPTTLSIMGWRMYTPENVQRVCSSIKEEIDRIFASP